MSSLGHIHVPLLLHHLHTHHTAIENTVHEPFTSTLHEEASHIELHEMTSKHIATTSLFRPQRLLRGLHEYVEPILLSDFTKASLYYFVKDKKMDLVDEELDAVMVDKLNIFEPQIPVDDYVLFVIKLAHFLHAAGETTHRLEYNLALVASKFGLECTVGAFPNMIMLTFGEKFFEEKSGCHIPSLYHRKSHVALCNSGVDGDRLLLGDSLVHLILQNKIPFRSAVCLLHNFEQRLPLFSMWVQILATSISSSAVAGVFFGGTWHDVMLCLLIGFLVGAFCYWSDRTPCTARLQLIFCGFLTAFLSYIFSFFVDPSLCLSSDVLSSLCWLLPGFSFTLGLIEVSHKSVSSGVSRVFYALIMCLQLGAGATFGFQLASLCTRGLYFDPNTIANHCPLSLSNFSWMFFFIMVITWIVLINSALRQWPIMIVTITITFIVYNYIYPLIGDNAARTIAATVIGLICNCYCRITNEPATVILLNAVFLLVPGSMGVRAVNSFLDSNYAIAYSFLLGMLSSGVSISVGLSISNLIVFPFEKIEFASLEHGI